MEGEPHAKKYWAPQLVDGGRVGVKSMTQSLQAGGTVGKRGWLIMEQQWGQRPETRQEAGSEPGGALHAPYSL